MKQKTEEKLKARALRKKGYTLNEITDKLEIAKSSASLWVRDVFLDKKAQARLHAKIEAGRLLTKESRLQKSLKAKKRYFDDASSELSTLTFVNKHSKLLCALIYWCEGTKNDTYRTDFTNSDPQLVKVFLKLFRDNFNLDNSKFHVCMHLHDYHNEKMQLKFWSQITKIPKKQFFQSYRKPHTGKRIRKGYQGCISIRYHDVNIGRELRALAEASFKKIL